MHLGIVSNCWQHQLAEGESLIDLIAEADRREYRAVELRQGSLGEFETQRDSVPQAKKLGKLPRKFPNIRFNVAIAFPYLNPDISNDDSLFLASAEAAVAVAGTFPPHLRLVDLETVEQPKSTAKIPGICVTLAELARTLHEAGGFLSIENSLQTWGFFHHIFQQTRELLGQDRESLRICYDAGNLTIAGQGGEAAETTRSLNADEIAMIHFKQRQNGATLPDVSDGDIDWAQQSAALEAVQFNGPALFEVQSDRRLWKHLEASKTFLAECGITFDD